MPYRRIRKTFLLFLGVDLEVTISAGTGAVNSARNDGSSTLGDLIGPNNAISVSDFN